MANSQLYSTTNLNPSSSFFFFCHTNLKLTQTLLRKYKQVTKIQVICVDVSKAGSMFAAVFCLVRKTLPLLLYVDDRGFPDMNDMRYHQGRSMEHCAARLLRESFTLFEIILLLNFKEGVICSFRWVLGSNQF